VTVKFTSCGSGSSSPPHSSVPSTSTLMARRLLLASRLQRSVPLMVMLATAASTSRITSTPGGTPTTASAGGAMPASQMASSDQAPLASAV
jgi:hypothetical protein